MKWAVYLQEVRKMRFQESYEGWQSGRLTQADAAEILGVCLRFLMRQPAVPLDFTFQEPDFRKVIEPLPLITRRPK